MIHISSASQHTKLPVKTIRYYADIGLVPPAKKTTAGYRLYDEASMRKLIFVRRARAFGFSITQCRELLGLYSNQKRSSADVKKITLAHLAKIKQKQQELQHLHDELTHLVETCKGDKQPECPIINSFSKA